MHVVKWVRGLLAPGHLLGNDDPTVGRIFMACQMCGRVRPIYRIADRTEVECWGCHGGAIRPIRLSPLRAAWWYFIKGIVWRKWMRRKREQRFWDPRMPVRRGEPEY